MTTDEQAFLAAIVAAPDDDGLRLAYADWLEGRGDVRGEFIRVQCALAANHYNPDAVAANCRCSTCEWARPLLVRERELLGAHALEWSDAVMRTGLAPACAMLADGVYGYGDAEWLFRRGFVEELTLPANSLLAHGDALTAAAPISKVTLSTWPDVLTFDRGLQIFHFDGRRNHQFADWVEDRHSPDDVCKRLLRAEWPRVKVWTLPDTQGPRGLPGLSGSSDVSFAADD